MLHLRCPLLRQEWKDRASEVNKNTLKSIQGATPGHVLLCDLQVNYTFLCFARFQRKHATRCPFKARTHNVSTSLTQITSLCISCLVCLVCTVWPTWSSLFLEPPSYTCMVNSGGASLP